MTGSVELFSVSPSLLVDWDLGWVRRATSGL